MLPLLDYDDYFNCLNVALEQYMPKGEIKPLIKKVKDSFGSRLAIASLELTFNVKYDSSTKTLDLTNANIREEITIELDRRNEEVVKVVYNKLKTNTAIDKAIDELRTYDIIDKAYGKTAHYETDDLSLRDIVLIIIDVNKAAEILINDNPEVVEKLSKFNKLCKHCLIDSNTGNISYTSRPELIDMLNKLKDM